MEQHLSMYICKYSFISIIVDKILCLNELHVSMNILETAW